VLLEAVNNQRVFKTEREGFVWTGFDINQLEQIRAPTNDCFRIVNNASRMSMLKFYLSDAKLELFMTSVVLQVSLHYGSLDSNYDLSNIALWEEHRPPQLCFMRLQKVFKEFQEHKLFLSRAYDPRCWTLDITR
jgi:hypothetical protein